MYKRQGYKFAILDSARGHSGLYKSVEEANAVVDGNLGFVDRENPETAFEPELNFTVSKKNLGKIIEKCINKHGLSEAAVLLDLSLIHI